MMSLISPTSLPSIAVRLKRIQRLCQSSGADALLLIAGLDGKYHAGTLMALNYIFCGQSGRDVIDSGKLPELLEDLVLVVTPESVSLFCHEAAVDELSKLLLPSCNILQMVCPTKEQADDPDAYEELKIAAFVQFLRSYKTIGVPLSAEMHSGKQMIWDPREVDLWPLVQAYGLEGVGKPGFFTQHFKVESISKGIQELYCVLDGLSLQQVALQQVENMRKQWLELIVNLWQRSPVTRNEFTEQQIAEPLTSYFMYGTIRNPMEVRQVVTMPPRVVFGSRSNDDKQLSEDVSMKDVVTTEGHPCVHMILEASDPKSPLCVARSFFLSRASLNQNYFADEEDNRAFIASVQAKHNAFDTTDVVYLAKLYSGLVVGASAAMEHFATTEGATVHSARAVAEQVFVRQVTAHAVEVDLAQVQQHMQFAIWSSDHANHVEPTAQRMSRRLKVLRVALKDIKSIAADHPGALLGALVYADTFVEIPAAHGKPAQLLNLTTSIPRMGAFSCHSMEAALCNNAKRSFLAWLAAAQKAPPQSPNQNGSRPASAAQAGWVPPGLSGPLGPLVSRGAEDAVMLSDNPIRPAEVGTLYLFAHGMVFVSRTACILAFDFRRHAESVEIWDMDCPESNFPAIGEALVIHGRSVACGLAPTCHLTDNHKVAVPLAAFSQGTRRQIMTKVLPTWHQTCTEAGIPWKKEGSTGSPFSPTLYSQQWAAVQRENKVWPIELPDGEVEAACRRLDEVELYAHYLPDQHIEAILQRTQPPPPDPAVQNPAIPPPPCHALPLSLDGASLGFHCAVSVVLVVGLPGAGQDLVAAVMQQMSGGQQCALIQYPEQGRASVDFESLEKVVSSAVASLCTPGAETSATFILTTATYDSVARQLKLLAQTSPFQKGCCKLSLVLTAVSSDCFFEDDACCQVLPGALEQAGAGLVDAVVLGGTTNVKQVQTILQQHNPAVPVLKASWPSLAKSASQLSPSQEDRQARLQQPDVVLKRYCGSTAAAAAPRGLLAGALQSVWLQFSGTVDMQKFREVLSVAGGCANGTTPSCRSLPLDVREPAASPCHILYCHAILRTNEGDALQVIEARRGLPPGTFHDWTPPAQLLNPPGILARQDPGGEVTVIGTGISKDSITQLLLSCQPQTASSTAQLQDASSLSQQELQSIREQHRFDPLPEGHYFTGSSFVDPYGDPSPDHPHMERFVSEHLAAARAEAQAEDASRAAQGRVLVVVDSREHLVGAAGAV